jgi:hypothetical protein
MRRAFTALAVVAVIVALGAPAQAQEQEQPKYRGFWIAFGAGGGWETWQWDFGTAGRGHSVYLRMGGTVNQHVLFGGEVLGWFNGAGNHERLNVTASALLYPFASGPWFLKGGWGLAQAGLEDRQGVGITLGSGFDHHAQRGSAGAVPTARHQCVAAIHDGRDLALTEGRAVSRRREAGDRLASCRLAA